MLTPSTACMDIYDQLSSSKENRSPSRAWGASSIQLKALRTKKQNFPRKEGIPPQGCSFNSCLSFQPAGPSPGFHACQPPNCVRQFLKEILYTLCPVALAFLTDVQALDWMTLAQLCQLAEN